MKQLEEQYLLCGRNNDIKRYKKDSINDLKEVFENFDENGNVVKTTYQTTKTLEDGKKHVLKLEVYHENNNKHEVISINDEKIFKWVYDENGILKEEKKRLGKSTPFFQDEITVFASDKIIRLKGLNVYKINSLLNGFYELDLIYKIDEKDIYDYSSYYLYFNMPSKKFRSFTVDNEFNKDKKTVYEKWNVCGDNERQYTKYYWNPKLNSYEQWHFYDVYNVKFLKYFWTKPNDLNECFLVNHNDKSNQISFVFQNNKGKEFQKIINNVEVKDNDTFKKIVFYIMDRRKEILKIKSDEVELVKLKNNEIYGVEKKKRK